MPEGTHDSVTLESRLATTESQIKRVGEDVAELSRNVGKLFDRVSSTGPNFAVLALWAGIILSIVFTIGGLVGFFYLREMDLKDRAVIALDTSIQRELATLRAGIRDDVLLVDKHSSERHSDALEAIRLAAHQADRVANYQERQAEAEIQELRERRRGEPLGPRSTQQPQ